MEELVLTDPVVIPGTTTATYRVKQLTLDWDAITLGTEKGLVQIGLRDNLGGTLFHAYTGTQAIDLMKWMNTANFSVNSMHKRILEKLSADGVIPGTVTGAPDA